MLNIWETLPIESANLTGKANQLQDAIQAYKQWMAAKRATKQ